MAKILLVEDDNNLREIYEARLGAEGYEIVTAQDGEQALAVAVKEKPDLIISDVMMPKISGFDMLDILRSTPETKNCKVIMMTALSQAEDKARADKLGADRYLVKSQVTLEDVAKVAKEVLEGTGTTPAASASETVATEPNAAPSTSSAIPGISALPTTPAPAPASAPQAVTAASVTTDATPAQTTDTTTVTSDSTTAQASQASDTTSDSTQTVSLPTVEPAQTATPTAQSNDDAKPAGEGTGFLVDAPAPVPESSPSVPPTGPDESSEIAASIESFLSTKEEANASTLPTPAAPVEALSAAPSIELAAVPAETPAEANAGLETMKFEETETNLPTPIEPHKLVLESPTTPTTTTPEAPGAPPAPATVAAHKVIQPLNDLSKPTVDLAALAQKEEEKQAVTDILNDTADSTTTPQAPANPTTPPTVDPNSLAL